MQVIDRNGFSETISSKERLASYQTVDFLSPQPYQKVLRVYSKTREGAAASKVTTYHPNGYLYQYLECQGGRAHGLYREWHPNGVQHIEAVVIEGTADVHQLAMASWIFEGQSTVWYEDGTLEAEISYNKGLLEGLSLYYHPNGALWKSIPFEHGEIHGLLTVYNPEGELLESSSYQQGALHGACQKFWGAQRPMAVERYELGLLQEGVYTDAQGALLTEIHAGSGLQALFLEGRLHSLLEYRKGVQEGRVQTFRADGSLHSTHDMREGKKQGEEWIYYPGEANTPKLLLHWQNDALQGVVKTWYRTGAIETQKEMHANKKRGLSFAWYEDGSLMYVEEYDNDSLIQGSYFRRGNKSPVSKVEGGSGVATIHEGSGLLLKKISYEKGKPVPDHR
jgi:antitoxin component YwqK of YwqJK toxin-antitoxin module